MVTDLMGNHIRLRKVAGRSETLIEFLEETGVEIDLAVRRAIEWPACCRCVTASRRHLPRKEYQCWLLVGFTGRLENTAPGVFGFGKNRPNERGRVIGRLALRPRTGLLRRTAAIKRNIAA